MGTVNRSCEWKAAHRSCGHLCTCMHAGRQMQGCIEQAQGQGGGRVRATHYSLLTTHYSLLTTHYSLLSLLTTHCSLLLLQASGTLQLTTHAALHLLHETMQRRRRDEVPIVT